MSRAKTLVMAFVLVLLGLYAWKFDREKVAQDRAESVNEQPKLVLDGVSAEQIDEIKVFYQGSSYTLRKTAVESQAKPGNGEPESRGENSADLADPDSTADDIDTASWHLAEPEKAPADAQAVAQLLESIISLSADNVIEATDVQHEQEIYGLNPPELLLILKGVFGQKVFSFGKENKLTFRRYLQPENDGRIFLVSTTAFSAAAKTGEDFRDRTPFSFETERLQSIVALRAGEKPIVFRKDAVDREQGVYRWRASYDGEELEVDKDLLERELSEVSSASVSEFVDDAGARLPFYGLVSPRLALRLEVSRDDIVVDSGSSADSETGPTGAKPRKANEIVLIQFGSGIGLTREQDGSQPGTAEKAYYAKIAGAPWVYRLERNITADWLQPIGHFRTRMPFNSLSTEDLVEIEVSRGSEKTLYRQVPDPTTETQRWEVALGDGQPVAAVDAGEFDAWLERIFQLRVLSYPDRITADDLQSGAYGLNSPRISIRLMLKPGQKSDKPAEQRVLIISSERVAQSGTDSTEPDNSSGQDSDAPYFGGIMFNAGLPTPTVFSAAEIRAIEEKLARIIPSETQGADKPILNAE